jgi:hypothetical protein
MIPVVMLAINTGMPSSALMTLHFLTVTCPSFGHILVAYLITVTARVFEGISKDADSMYLILENIIYVPQVAHMMLSLLDNIFATSIIAHKAWCVHVYGILDKHFVDCASIGDTTCAYIQEIPQVTDEKRDRYSKPFLGNKDIGSPGRVRYDLYLIGVSFA